jgi:hypothetical protein
MRTASLRRRRDNTRRKIAAVDADDFRRRPEALHDTNEVAVGGDDRDHSRVARPVEDYRIGSAEEVMVIDAHQIGQDIGEHPNQLWGEILI